jgi:hypothetical protein
MAVQEYNESGANKFCPNVHYAQWLYDKGNKVKIFETKDLDEARNRRDEMVALFSGTNDYQIVELVS